MFRHMGGGGADVTEIAVIKHITAISRYLRHRNMILTWPSPGRAYAPSVRRYKRSARVCLNLGRAWTAHVHVGTEHDSPTPSPQSR